jgi:hypothetical protein
MAALKREHCHPGDVLVDDRVKHRHLWIEAGGVFIVHRNARSSIEKLRALAGGDPRIEFRVHPSDEELQALYRSRASGPDRTQSKPGGGRGRS